MTSNTSCPTPCFVCGKVLESAANDEAFATVPYEGTQFNTYGHYGSTIYDPNFVGVDQWLELNICDECLVNGKGRVVRCIPRPTPSKPAPIREPWNGLE